jgi:hypothetical protein
MEFKTRKFIWNQSEEQGDRENGFRNESSMHALRAAAFTGRRRVYLLA